MTEPRNPGYRPGGALNDPETVITERGRRLEFQSPPRDRTTWGHRAGQAVGIILVSLIIAILLLGGFKLLEFLWQL